MLRITVELVPNGRESGKRTLAIAELSNVAGGALADYEIHMTEESVPGALHAEIKRYPRWSTSPWDLVIRAIAKALTGRERLPARPRLLDVPVYYEDGRAYGYVKLSEIPEPARSAFAKNIAHSSVPGLGRAFAHDWTDFQSGQR